MAPSTGRSKETEIGYASGVRLQPDERSGAADSHSNADRHLILHLPHQLHAILAGQRDVQLNLFSGANVAAALRLARTLSADSIVVTVLCDDGARYLSEHFWDD